MGAFLLQKFRKGSDFMGRPRKFGSVKALEVAWEAYKAHCDNRMVLTHDFSAKNSEFVSKELKRSITYTIEGFCVFAGISRASFYERYANEERFADIVTRMKEECEVDARAKFELGVIPSQLAGLWMSKHGYSTKTEGDKEEQEARIAVLNAKLETNKETPINIVFTKASDRHE